MEWEDAWEELAKIGLYRSGSDVSQVGTTWLEGLVATGSVRPFTDDEVDSMGGAGAFFPAMWQTALVPWGQSRKVWAIPWLVDTRVVFYWRDMLEEAGIDETTAFVTLAQVEETMAHLQDSGIEVPWGIWALGGGIALQNAASWVWSYGGDFLAADGRQLLFDRPEAIKGFTGHLKLCRYMPPGIKSIDAAAIDARGLFAQRRVAVMMGLGGWLSYFLEQSGVSDVKNRLGVAAPPEPAFVGGSSLIVWRHTHQAQAAVTMVRTLTSKHLVQALARDILGFFPACLDVWAEPPYADDPHYKAVARAIKAGRTFPVVPKWGMFENKLNQTVIQLWDTVLAEPDQDLADLVGAYMASLARRLAVSLGIPR
ncbi:MAG: extracellular solute-binding protein [Anaerolineae bacterium]|nr:extracellular solute-binding protein [Anaerolineae bacterium]